MGRSLNIFHDPLMFRREMNKNCGTLKDLYEKIKQKEERR